MSRFGPAPCTSYALPPLHVILRAPGITLAADSPAIMVDEGCLTVERLTLRAGSFIVNNVSLMNEW